jgi:uncharacterized membrane protein
MIFPLICHLLFFATIHCQPIFHLQHAPRGTNGGVTISGLVAAAAGGAVIGLTFVVAGLFTASCEGQLASKQLLAFPIGAFAGLFGSVIDSVLGATVQYSGFCAVRKKVTYEFIVLFILELFYPRALE